jgi:hypothetical protein
MEREGLLVSDSYGVMVQGVEKLWRISPHAPKGLPIKQAKEFLRAAKDSLIHYGCDPDFVPPPKIHAKLYWHEMHCGSLFLELALTGKLHAWWDGEPLTEGICDKVFGFSDDRDQDFLLEQEEGNQYAVMHAKVAAYVKHWKATKDRRKPLICVPDAEGVKKVRPVFQTLNLPDRYFVATLDDLTTNRLDARLYANHREYTLLEAANL